MGHFICSLVSLPPHHSLLLDLCQGLRHDLILQLVQTNQESTPMDSVSLPVPLAKAVMSLIPAPALSRAIAVVMRRMMGRHPKLFSNLSSLTPARVHLVPTDMPHGFILAVGQNPVLFDVIGVGAQDGPPDAVVSGSLLALVDMLEGRVDGDKLFFSRDITIAGDTSVIVGLRNTLDREEIDLFAEITSLCGPFALPARAAIGMLDAVARKLKARLSTVHDSLHEERAAP